MDILESGVLILRVESKPAGQLLFRLNQNTPTQLGQLPPPLLSVFHKAGLNQQHPGHHLITDRTAFTMILLGIFPIPMEHTPRFLSSAMSLQASRGECRLHPQTQCTDV